MDDFFDGSEQDGAPLSRREAKRLESKAASKKSSKPKKEKPAKSTATPDEDRGATVGGPLNWIVGSTVGLLVVALIGGAFGLGFMGSSVLPEPEIPTETTPPPREVPTEMALPVSLQTCSLTPELSSVDLGQVYFHVVENDSGKVIRSEEGDFAVYGGDISRIPTVISGLLSLGRDFQMETKIFLGETPGTLVVKGYGDVTLSRLASGTTIYPDRARLSTLVQNALEAYFADPDLAETPITEVYFDSSYFVGDDWNSKWDNALRNDGTLSRITALQLDGDRSTPSSLTSKRSNDPIAVFMSKFEEYFNQYVPEEMLQELADAEIQTQFVQQTTPNVGAELATVRSAKYSSLVPLIITSKDRTLTETIARHVAINQGGSGSFADATGLIAAPLNTLGLDLSRVSMNDAFGTSVDNRVSASFLAQLSKEIFSNNALVSIHSIMPTSGHSGDLSKRLVDGGLKDRVRAFVGTGKNATTLFGYVITNDGTQYHFGIISDKTGSKAVAAVDAIVAKLYQCGANLSNR